VGRTHRNGDCLEVLRSAYSIISGNLEFNGFKSTASADPHKSFLGILYTSDKRIRKYIQDKEDLPEWYAKSARDIPIGYPDIKELTRPIPMAAIRIVGKKTIRDITSRMKENERNENKDSIDSINKELNSYSSATFGVPCVTLFEGNLNENVKASYTSTSNMKINIDATGMPSIQPTYPLEPLKCLENVQCLEVMLLLIQAVHYIRISWEEPLMV